MNAEEFVDAIRSNVMRSAVEDVIQNLIDPPGRQPAPKLLRFSQWYLALGQRDRDMVRGVLAEVSHAAVFGVFAVLDGVRRVDPAQPPGELELWYTRGGDRTRLDGDLHDELNSEPWHDGGNG